MLTMVLTNNHGILYLLNNVVVFSQLTIYCRINTVISCCKLQNWTRLHAEFT